MPSLCLPRTRIAPAPLIDLAAWFMRGLCMAETQMKYEKLTIDVIEQLMNRQHPVSLAPDGTVPVIPAGSASERLIEVTEEKENLRAELNKLHTLLNTPETENFDKAVTLEAAPQVKRWTAEHDAGKSPEDWFWLLGYLAGKALAACRAGDLQKAKHHCISSAAALRNWHAHLRTGQSAMRPGIAEPK